MPDGVLTHGADAAGLQLHRARSSACSSTKRRSSASNGCPACARPASSTCCRSARTIAAPGSPSTAPRTPEPGREPSSSYRIASPRYYETMRIPHRRRATVRHARQRGRRAGGAGQPDVGAALPRRAVADRPARAAGPRADAPWLTIVGVVGDVHHSQLTEAPDPEIHVPIAQAPPSMMMLAVRGDGRPEDLTRLGARGDPGDRSSAAGVSRQDAGTTGRRFAAAAQHVGRR